MSQSAPLPAPDLPPELRRPPRTRGVVRCFVPREDGRPCGEPVRRTDSCVQEGEGMAFLLRIVYCRVHGYRRHAVRDEGPSTKGYAPRRSAR